MIKCGLYSGDRIQWLKMDHGDRGSEGYYVEISAVVSAQ